jgi:hypothetical protein
MGFSADVAAAIALLGGPEGDRVVDFLVDPGAACRALDAVPEHSGLVVRAAPEAGAAAPGYGPPPVAPLWIRLMRGAREVGTAPLRGGDGMVRRAARVQLDEREEGCCDAPGCTATRTHAEVWLVLDRIPEPGAPERLLIAEQRLPGDAPGGPGAAIAVAARLSDALGVPLHRGDEPVTVDAGEPPPALGEALPLDELARFAVRSEGERVVLRNWDSAGPRASAGRSAAIGTAFVLLAVTAWFALSQALGKADARGLAIAEGIAGALFTVAAYAFLGVARFAARYSASSAPQVAVARDRLVLAPWVSRDGAVDARLEGRLGAAIPLGEVRAASPKPRPPGVAVELDTDHGAIDAVVCAGEASAKLWGAVLNRAIDEARHPRQAATARQRARQRAGAPG